MLADEENEQDIGDIPEFDLEDITKPKKPKKTCLTCAKITDACSRKPGLMSILCNAACPWGRLEKKCVAGSIPTAQAILFILASLNDEPINCPAWTPKQS